MLTLPLALALTLERNTLAPVGFSYCRTRSGEGNVFTGVFHSVCPQEDVSQHARLQMVVYPSMRECGIEMVW